MKLPLLSERGFALPVVLVLSLVLLIIGLSTLQVTSSISRSLGDQSWNRLAQEAAQAGTSYAASCLRTADSVTTTTWTSLTPATKCDGTSSGASIYYAQADSSDSPQWRAKFTVSPISAPANGKSRITVTGTLELMGAAGAVTKTYTSGNSVVINLGGSGLPTTGLKAKKVVVSPYTAGTVTCALTDGQSVYCAGLNTSGQLGDGTTTSRSTPVKFDIGTKKATDVFIGLYHTCVLTADSELYCAGLNNYGQLGDGSTTNRSTPVKYNVSAGAILSVSLGQYTTCVVKSTGAPNAQAYCAGQNNAGQLGDNSTTNRSTPVLWGASGSADNNFARKVSTNGTATCVSHAPTSSPYSPYSIKCAGSNSYGQFGCGATSGSCPTSSSAPILASLPVVGGTPQQIYAENTTVGDPSYGPICTFIPNRDAYCAGYGNDGQLGQGSFSSSNTFIRFGPPGVTGGDMVRAVSGFYGTTCVITSWAGQTYCSGYNNAGQLGIGTTSKVASPALFTLSGGGSPVADSVVVGYATICVGSTWHERVFCAGSNASGQIGIGNTTNQLYAVPYGSGLAAKSVAIAYTHICVITTGEDVYCSGNNTYGQLGDASTTQRNSPVKFTLP